MELQDEMLVQARKPNSPAPRVIDSIMAQIYRELHDAAKGSLNKMRFDSLRSNSRGGAVLAPIGTEPLMLGFIKLTRCPEYVRAERGFRNNISTDVLAAVSNGSNRVNVDNRKVLERYTAVADESLMILCILSFSRKFRSVCMRADQVEFDGMLARLRPEFESLEYFAKSRGLKWLNLLRSDREFTKHLERKLEKNPNYMRESLGPVAEEHPHTRIVPNDSGVLAVPSFKGRNMVDVPSCIYRGDMFDHPSFPRPENWPRAWHYPSDPTLPSTGEKCINCGVHSRRCNCDPLDCDIVVRPLVELRQYGDKGVGIRTLQDLKEGDVLGEFVGEIIPTGAAYGLDFSFDEDYAFALDVSPQHVTGQQVLADISSKQFGNWTRFLNHSCNASVESRPLVLGKRLRIMMIAKRDVLAFEELTLDYGDDYWVGRYCLCRTEICRFPPPWTRMEDIKSMPNTSA